MTDRTSASHQAGRGFPTGTVTFLFTDIEGSTRLVQELGDAAWAPLLERHREIVRRAIAEAGGIEVQTEGDSFFAVFPTAAQAIAAASEAQRQLDEAKWPEGVTIAVRMGVHTGEGRLDADGSYVGADVHRAARIAGAAHGGQVVLSDATRILLGEALPKGVSLLDLGQHRLKDLRAERLSQLCIAGIRNSFPPLRALDRQPNNLPTHLTSFVGRETELAKASDLLAHSRLLTLTGPGGTGKTRLALQLAADRASAFPDGVWFIALEPIRDPDLALPTIARTLGVSLSSGRPALDLVSDWIGQMRMLLILDNFEQVIAAAPVVAALLHACPSLKIICTSRSVLRVSGEQEYQVPGLPAPPDLGRLTPMQREALPEDELHPDAETLGQYEAVRLFIARALNVRADFAVTNQNAPAVAQICARLQGMPLAIELAAARVKLLTPQQILDRLEHQLTLLTSGSRDLPERQQTLRGAIAWSYDLLEEPLARLVRQLAIFSGGWDLEAAEAVIAGSDVDLLEGLSQLIDHSLVRDQEDGEGATRFEMLPTIREYLIEIMESAGELTGVADRHAAHYLALAERAAPELQGDRQRIWLDRLEREHDNLRAALDWLAEKPDPEIAVRIAFAIWRFWQQRGYVTEARQRVESLLEKDWDLPGQLQARLLEVAGGIAYWQADHEPALRWYRAALELWRRLGDKREIANAIYNYTFAELIPAIRAERVITDYDAEVGLRRCREALQLFREVGDRVGQGNIMWTTGTLNHYMGRYEEARDWYKQAIAAFKETGQKTMEAWGQHMMVLPLVRLARMEEAEESGGRALAHFHGAGDLAGVAMVLRNLSGIAAINGDRRKAGLLHGAAEKLAISTGAGLTSFMEEVFHGHDPKSVLSADELSAYVKESERMSLDAIVALATSDTGSA